MGSTSSVHRIFITFRRQRILLQLFSLVSFDKVIRNDITSLIIRVIFQGYGRVPTVHDPIKVKIGGWFLRRYFDSSEADEECACKGIHVRSRVVDHVRYRMF